MKVLTSGKWSKAVLVVIAGAGGGVVAQQLLERHSAKVSRTAPAVVDLGESVLERLRVPHGFEVSIFARNLGAPRMMEVGADGTVYVTRRETGDVVALRDGDGDGRAEHVHQIARELPNVHGIDIHDGKLYLASSTTVWTAPLDAAAPSAVVTPRVLIDHLPDGGQHGNRTLRFGPDGWMYVSIGSSCNDCAEQNQLERATLTRYTPDGLHREFIANGLRNTIGYDWHPRTQGLWGMDHGSDFRGDTIPPEELNRIEPGRNYGWPICYGAQVVDAMTNAQPGQLALQPGQAGPSRQSLTREQYCALTEPSVLTHTAHAAPMAMRFYDGKQFPRRYHGDAFVAMRGSWNRDQPRGYNVVRIRFDDAGQPQQIDNFLGGLRGEGGAQIYGRPVGIAIAADGALLVSDDANGAIYRVAYTGAR